MSTAVTPPAGSEVEGQPPAVTPQAVNPAQEARLSTENAGLRVKNKELAARVAAIEELGSLEDIKAALDAAKAGSPSGDGKSKAAEVARLQREYDALKAELGGIKTSLADQQSKATQKLKTAELTRIAAEGGLNAQASAVRLLGEVAKVAADDVVVFVVPDGSGGTREVPATLENLKVHAKDLLGDAAEVFLPAAGKPGTGSKGPGKSAGGLDLATILADPDLYAKHRDQVLQERFGRVPPK